jgi:hypothetical protein
VLRWQPCRQMGFKQHRTATRPHHMGHACAAATFIPAAPGRQYATVSDIHLLGTCWCWCVHLRSSSCQLRQSQL